MTNIRPEKRGPHWNQHSERRHLQLGTFSLFMFTNLYDRKIIPGLGNNLFVKEFLITQVFRNNGTAEAGTTCSSKYKEFLQIFIRCCCTC